MAEYSIDPDRGTLTITGTFSGKQRQNLITLAAAIADCSDDTASIVVATTTVTAPFGGYVTVEEYISGAGTPPGPFIGPVDYGIRLTAVSGFGDTDTATIYRTINPKASGVPTGNFGTDVIAAYEGTFEFVFTLESLLDVTGSGFPSYAGASIVDTPPLTDVAGYERFVPGEAVSVSISADVDFTVSRDNISGNYTATGSGTATASDTLTTDVLFSDYAFTLTNQVVNCYNDSVTASAELDDWLGATRPTLACTSTAGSASTTSTAGGLASSVAVSAVGACLAGYGTATNTVAPKRIADLAGVVRRMEEGYTGAEVQVWDGASYQDKMGDSWTHTVEQEQYSGSVSSYASDGSSIPSVTDSDSNSDSVDEWSPIWARLKASWLSAQSLEAGLWRYMFRVFPTYDVFSLVQAAERTVLTAYSGTGSGDISRTISLANGADTDLDGSDWSGFSLHGYACLKIRLKKSSGSHAVTVKIGSKEWNKDKSGNALTVTTAYQVFTLDLLNPTNATTEADAKDSRFPYASVSPIVVDDTEMWGVSNATAIVLTGLDSDTYDVDYVKLARESYSRVTVIPGYDYWVDASPGNTREYSLRLLTGDTDGCRSKETIALDHDTMTGTYTHWTLDEVIDSINGAAGSQPADGYTATASIFSSSGCSPVSPDLAPLQDCYLNLDRHAAWLEGGGAKYASGAWDYCFRESIATAKTMQAQMLADRLLFWPPGLDLFGLGSGDDVFLPFATILKSRAVGVVADEDGKRAPSVSVEIDGGTDGSASTATDGSYYTGTPYAKGATTKDVTASVGDSPPSASIDFKTRAEHRVCFRVVSQSGTGTFHLQDWHGQFHLSTNVEGDLYYYRSDSSVPLPAWAVNTAQVTDVGNVDGRGVMAIDWRDRLTLVYSDGTDTYDTVSDDDGATWGTAAMAIPGGTKPFVVADRSGNLLEAAVVGSGISARTRAAGDTAWGSIIAFVDDAGDPLVVDTSDCFCISAAHDSPGRYLLTCLIDGESGSSLWYCTDPEASAGLTWTRIS